MRLHTCEYPSGDFTDCGNERCLILRSMPTGNATKQLTELLRTAEQADSEAETRRLLRDYFGTWKDPYLLRQQVDDLADFHAQVGGLAEGQQTSAARLGLLLTAVEKRDFSKMENKSPRFVAEWWADIHLALSKTAGCFYPPDFDIINEVWRETAGKNRAHDKPLGWQKARRKLCALVLGSYFASYRHHSRSGEQVSITVAA